MDKLVLEIKAVSLIGGSEAQLKSMLQDKVTGSHDEAVKRFVKAVQFAQPAKTGRLVAIAVGELVMAAILVVAGVVALVPSVAGVDTFSALVQYLLGGISGSLETSPLSAYLSFIEFLVGLVLVLSAFYTLREAASKLKEAGLAVKPGEI